MRVGSHIRTIPNDWHMLNLGRRPLATLGAGLTTVEHTTQIVMKIAQAVGGAEANPDRHLLHNGINTQDICSY